MTEEHFDMENIKFKEHERKRFFAEVIRTTNLWGFHPIEYKVLIEVEEFEKLAGKDRVIIIPDSVADKFQVAQIKGKIIAMGGNAFEEMKGTVPKVGDKVYFAKYSGVHLRRDDKNGKRIEGRVVNDKDVIGVLDPEIENIEV